MVVFIEDRGIEKQKSNLTGGDVNDSSIDSGNNLRRYFKIIVIKNRHQ